MKLFVKRILGVDRYERLLPKIKELFALLYRRNLPALARLFGSDKWGNHRYAQHYQQFLQHLRNKPIVLLEVGIGGYADPLNGGQSLRMWRAYFRKGLICGVDIYDKKAMSEPRIRIFQGSQDDPVFLRNVVADIGTPDVIVDDGSHINAHVQTTFETLFPLLANDGVYIVEDTQTSYWPGFGGEIDPRQDESTMMGYFKRLTDGINHMEWIRPGYQPSYFDRHVVAIYFVHNMIFIFKGKNDEKSNVLDANSTDQQYVLAPLK